MWHLSRPLITRKPQRISAGSLFQLSTINYRLGQNNQNFQNLNFVRFCEFCLKRQITRIQRIHIWASSFLRHSTFGFRHYTHTRDIRAIRGSPCLRKICVNRDGVNLWILVMEPQPTQLSLQLSTTCHAVTRRRRINYRLSAFSPSVISVSSVVLQIRFCGSCLFV
jgi:hypothetical protein